MLSIRNLETPRQAANYFLRDDYYHRSTQAQPSRWWGRGAAALGLEGEVDRTSFEAALAGRLPHGVVLMGRDGGDERRPGFDLTLSAPKSVSLLALVQGAEAVRAAHVVAVDATLTYLEREAAQTRATVDRVTKAERTSNMIVAQFSHDTSRELDPQLHTHCVVINATRRRDGAWRSLSNERIYELKMLGGAIYRATLASELHRLGYETERSHADGRFEVRGFTDAQFAHFSKRRSAIEAALAERGAAGAIASERAALLTRAAKREVDREGLGAVWRDQAREVGIVFPEPQPVRQLQRGRRIAADRAVEGAIDHLAERRAVFEERQMLAYALAEAGGRATLLEVEQAVGRQVQRGVLVPVLARRSAGGRAFTTAKGVAREQALVAGMELARGRFEPILSAEAVRAAAGARALTAGQGGAAELVLTSGDGIVGVQGYAGTGKTTALRFVRELAERAGYEVRGMAPSAAAALLLQEEAGIASQTLASHLIEQGRAPARQGLRRLWIVDEASMLANDDALRLVTAAQRAGARLVLVGDRDQLPAVEAGAPFRLLVSRGLPLATMDEILRQKDLVVKAAVEHTIARSPKALEVLAPAIAAIPDAGRRLETVAREYLATPAGERERLLVLAVSNAERRELNVRIRDGLRNEGQLAGAEVPAMILASRDLTTAQLRTSTHYVPGDVVRFGRGYRGLGVSAGDYLTVERIEGDRKTVHLRRSDGSTIAWRPARAAQVEVYRPESRGLSAGDRIRWTRNDKGRARRNGELARVIAVEGGTATIELGGREQRLELATDRHWDHAYATTVHAAQGKTANRVILCLDTERKQLTGHESWYVAISRAREGLRIYTDDAQRLPRAVQRSMAQETALEAVFTMPGRGR